MAMGAGTAEVEAFFKKIRQGNVFTLADANPTVSLLFPTGTAQVAVVSQTCDAVLPKRPTIILAPVVTLSGDLAHQAAHRAVPQYIPVPSLGENEFVDLAHIHAVNKELLAGCAVSDGIDNTDDEAVRAFALAAGRWFSRFAFPDEVVPWLNPLLTTIRQKYTRPNSPLGKVLHDVVEFRVEAEKWSARPLDLTLHVIVRAGSMPTVPPDEIDNDVKAAAYNNGVLRTPEEIANLLIAAKTNRARATLWLFFADSLALQCHPRPQDATEDIRAAVSAVTAEIWSDDEFPLSRIRKSELLDVEYLSEGYPV